ncbi:hypothetical protein GDO78_000706 [Eleutherodactylus coqui]|uniref:Uncharacterized protein n=1 Tax=Eleutherodactylus coqui TaxID=57060 RepID=A0A8J6KGQ7_ELECQ|nr:hypothetical protein GDO78_000706 [Eleutherodactylus coqui]KAG9492337.1 hypothetical protein GDO78_000706 [Eleutherodactylus coqui]KAG9492338.1 hypothetical protein GDO78_000706 [Eleutherodactylus coqui]KAG9492339.1 hypothetical protein GDO78_000706 [Eleutherodactylus coqui]
MDISTVKTENGKVSYETPEGTVVHININQRSAFDCLLDTFRFLWDLKKSQKTKPARMIGSPANLGFGVAYVSLGLVSVMLAILLCIVQPSLSIFHQGMHFWVGFPFIVSGILNLVAYKFPKACWMALAFVSLVVNVGVSIGGLVITVCDLYQSGWYSAYNEDICTELRNQRNYYGTAAPPRYYYNDLDYNMRQCKEGLQKYQYLIRGLTIMSLLLLIWGLCLAILSVGSRVKSFCCSCKGEITEEKADALITSNLSDDIIIA